MSADTYAVGGGPGNHGSIFEQVDALNLKIERMEENQIRRGDDLMMKFRTMEANHKRVVDDLEQRIKAMDDDKSQRGVDRTHFYDKIGKLMLKVDALGPVVEGHTRTLETKVSTVDRDLDRAAMQALEERVKKLEKPWFGGFGKTRAAQNADVSRLLRRMNEFNSDMSENRVAHIKD